VLVGRAKFTLERAGLISNIASEQGSIISSSKGVEIETVPSVDFKVN
jgi:hypothetical protein